MLKVSVKGLWAHKRRLVGTGTAVLLGVAFLAGTLVLGDTLRAGFDELFTTANANTDAVVRSSTTVGTGETEQRPPIDRAVIDDVRRVDGVAAAAPSVEGRGQILDSNGDAIGGEGPPTLAGNWIEDPKLNPYELVGGRGPRAPNEVVIDKASADDGGLRIGGQVRIQTPELITARIVGLATYGGTEGGVTYAGFTLPAAQENLLGGTDRVDSVRLAAEPGVSQEELVTRLRPVLPDQAEALTGTEFTDEQRSDIEGDFLAFFETFLLVFTGIALLVAAFSIYNTFSIVVAQRTRESALLRAMGASRRQVLSSIVIEAVVVGLIASGLGLAAGVGLAVGLLDLMAGIGLELPGGLEVGLSAVVTSMLVGTIVTVLASALPAIRASRVAPLAALRNVAVDRAGASRIRLAIGLVAAGTGAALVVQTGLDASEGALGRGALGAVLLLVGMVVLGPAVARPASALIGAPLPWLRGVSGALARRNAMRNPRRTAGTAAALMVGVGVVSLFTVVGASVKASIDDTVSQSFGGDLVIESDGFSGSGLDPDLTQAVHDLPEVDRAAGLGFGSARLGGRNRNFTTTDPARLDGILDVDVTAGSLVDLADDELGVASDVAEDEGWRVGSRVPVVYADGARQTLMIGAIYEPSELINNVVVPTASYAPHTTQRSDVAVLIDLAPGVSLDAGDRAVAQVADRFAAPDPQDRDEYIDSVAGELDQFLAVVYVLLALSILIALMGIANTLSLSVHERTRELGLLRAVGQTRRQLRLMVRWESVVVAVFGTLGGLGMGLLCGWGLVKAVAVEAPDLGTVAIPAGSLAAVLLIGGLVGIVAGLRPARRAAKLDVLAAVSSD